MTPRCPALPAQVTPSGVLHIPPGAIDAGLGPEPEALEAEAQRAREMDLPIGAGAPLDWKLGDVVDTVGRGFRWGLATVQQGTKGAKYHLFCWPRCWRAAPCLGKLCYLLHLLRMPCWSHELLPCPALQPCPTAHGTSPCRNLIEGEPLAESAPGPPPAKPSRAAGGGEAGAGVRLQRPPSVPLMVEDTQKTNLNPLLLDASEDFAPREGEARPGAAARPACAAHRCALLAASTQAQQTARRSASTSPEPSVGPRPHPPVAPAERPLPDPSFVIAIDSFTVTRGQLVRVPNFFYQVRSEGGGRGAIQRCVVCTCRAWPRAGSLSKTRMRRVFAFILLRPNHSVCPVQSS